MTKNTNSKNIKKFFLYFIIYYIFELYVEFNLLFYKNNYFLF